MKTQIDGTHYTTMQIQPLELSAALKLDAFRGAMLKYITRYQSKGKGQDLDKAVDYFEKGIELGALKANWWELWKHDYVSSSTKMLVDEYYTKNRMLEDQRLAILFMLREPRTRNDLNNNLAAFKQAIARLKLHHRYN